MLALLFWRCLALVFVALGLIGVVVPGMPTTVFMLLAAWASGRGWPALNRWLLEHPRYGPPIHNWYRHRAIPRRAKWLAAASMLVSMALIYVTADALWVKWGLISVMCVVLAWLWTRPEPGGDVVRESRLGPGCPAPPETGTDRDRKTAK